MKLGEEEWLKMPRWLHGIFYMAVYTYSKLSMESLLANQDADTYGGTIVSTVHQGIDSFALCYVPSYTVLVE